MSSLALTKETAADLTLRQQCKPTLDLIEPGRIGGRVMNMIARPRRQPVPHCGVLVRRIVVDHEVDIEIARHIGLDMLQKAEELLAPMAPATLGEHAAIGDVALSDVNANAVATDLYKTGNVPIDSAVELRKRLTQA